jgi:hypothetical protein
MFEEDVEGEEPPKGMAVEDLLGGIGRISGGDGGAELLG